MTFENQYSPLHPHPFKLFLECSEIFLVCVYLNEIQQNQIYRHSAGVSFYETKPYLTWKRVYIYIYIYI